MKKILFIAVFLLLPWVAFTQTWKSQADTLVLNQVAASLIGHADIFALPDVLTSTDSIFLSDGTYLHVPYSSCYAYFIDLMPFANWGHPCQYCFVNASLNHTVVQENAPPKDLDMVELALYPRPKPNPHPVAVDTTFVRSRRSADTKHLWAVLICGNCGSDYERFWFDLSSVYTVLANVYGYQEKGENNDFYERRIIALAPEFVLEYNTTNDSPFPLSGNLNGYHSSNDIFGDFFNNSNNGITGLSKENLENIFKCFAGNSQCLQDYESEGLTELTQEDQLFIYITGHGESNNYGTYIPIDEYSGSHANVYDTTLTRWLRDINCSQMTLLMQSCHSGGFVEHFLDDIDNPNCLCKNRVGQSAASAEGLSWGEGYGVYQNSSKDIPHTMVDEFTYYWTSAALGYYPYFSAGDTVTYGPWTQNNRVVGSGYMNWSDYFGWYETVQPHTTYDVDPDTDGDGVLSFNELFEFANNLDSWSAQGYYHPHPNQNPGETYETPQQEYESSFTLEAATPMGYEGQIDNIAFSGTAIQPYRLCGDLFVNTDAELTMLEEIQSPENVKICVKPGGSLILSGGTLTNLPGSSSLWKGVQVWGNSAKPQYFESGHFWQGRLEMSKGATIANAVIGVDVWHPEDLTTTGGVVNAIESHFINNSTAVHFPPYEHYYTSQDHPNTQFYMDNLSSFYNCDFIVNSNYLGPANFERHVDLYRVRGISFRGCDFVFDNAPYSLPSTSGIFALDAGFNLGGICMSGNNQLPCTQIDKNNFTGFNKAVVAMADGSTGTRPVTISYADFNDNDFGIYALNSGVTHVHQSTFSVGRGNSSDCGVGVFTDNVFNFSIEFDTFRPAAQHPYEIYGTVIKDSQSQNLIQYNTFNNLYCANLSIGKNNTATPPFGGIGQNSVVLGLEYRCNENWGNQCDFFVKGGISPAQLGVQPNQGALRCAASNTFSPNAYHFWNEGDYLVNYYYDPSLSYGTPSNNYGVTLVQTTDTLGCDPSVVPGSGGGGTPWRSTLTDDQRRQRESDYEEAFSAYTAIKALYDQKIDGGDSEAEIAHVQSATSSDLWALRARLLGDSPYLSFETLRNTADRDDILPQSVIFEILSSNPDEMKNDTLITYLRTKDNPLPDYMIAILQQVANGVTARTAMEAQMARCCQQFRQAATDIVRSILNDTVVDKTELIEWLGNMRDMEADRNIISICLEDGRLETASSLAEMLPTLYGLTGAELEEYGSYMEMLDLYKDLYRDGRNSMQLDSTEMAMVERIMDEDGGTASAMAKALMMGHGYRILDCPSGVQWTREGDRSMDMTVPVTDYNSAMGFCVEVSPNPANTWAAVDYTLPAETSTARLCVANTLGTVVLECDLSGAISQKILDLRELGAGLYTYTVACGKLLQSGKLVIVK